MGKTYNSMEEIEKDFFPALHKERLARKSPREVAREMVDELMLDMRAKLVDRTEWSSFWRFNARCYTQNKRPRLEI